MHDSKTDCNVYTVCILVLQTQNTITLLSMPFLQEKFHMALPFPCHEREGKRMLIIGENA